MILGPKHTILFSCDYEEVDVTMGGKALIEGAGGKICVVHKPRGAHVTRGISPQYLESVF